MKKCTYCGRENTDQAGQCLECGTEFESVPSPIPTLVANAPGRSDAERNMLHGALWCGGGILVTVFTYAAASGGGTYVVAWGAIIFGAIQFFKGLANRNKQPSANQPNATDDGYEALEAAARLQQQGRIQEATTAYQQIAQTYSGLPAGRDAQISLDNLRTGNG